MRGFNSILMSGAITRVPELKTSGSGLAILNLDVGGVEQIASHTGEVKEIPFYQRATAFGKFAEMLAQQLEVGTIVTFTGRLNYRSWEDQSGNKRSAVDVNVNQLWITPDGEVTYDSRNQPRLVGAVNEVLLAGNLGVDGELRYTPQGFPVSRLALAVNETYTSGGSEQQKTGWYTVESWHATAEASAELKKGTGVVVRGRLRNDSYKTDAGESRYVSKIEAYTVSAVARPPRKEEPAPQEVREPVAAAPARRGRRTKKPTPAELEVEFPSEKDLPF